MLSILFKPPPHPLRLEATKCDTSYSLYEQACCGGFNGQGIIWSTSSPQSLKYFSELHNFVCLCSLQFKYMLGLLSYRDFPRIFWCGGVKQMMYYLKEIAQHIVRFWKLLSPIFTFQILIMPSKIVSVAQAWHGISLKSQIISNFPTQKSRVHIRFTIRKPISSPAANLQRLRKCKLAVCRQKPAAHWLTVAIIKYAYTYC